MHRIPYDHALAICKLCAWPIRHLLVPLFGPAFVDQCVPTTTIDKRSLPELCSRALAPAIKALNRNARREPTDPYPRAGASFRRRSAFRPWSSSSFPVLSRSPGSIPSPLAPVSLGVPNVTFAGPAFSSVASSRSAFVVAQSTARGHAAYRSAFPYLASCAPASSGVTSSSSPACPGLVAPRPVYPDASNAVFSGLGASSSSGHAGRAPVLSVPVASRVGFSGLAASASCGVSGACASFATYSDLSSSAQAYSDSAASSVPYSGLAPLAPAFIDSVPSSTTYPGLVSSAPAFTDSAASCAASSDLTASLSAFSGGVASGLGVSVPGASPPSSCFDPAASGAGSAASAPAFSGAFISGSGVSAAGVPHSAYTGVAAFSTAYSDPAASAFSGGVVSGPAVSVSGPCVSVAGASSALSYFDPAASGAGSDFPTAAFSDDAVSGLGMSVSGATSAAAYFDPAASGAGFAVSWSAFSAVAPASSVPGSSGVGAVSSGGSALSDLDTSRSAAIPGLAASGSAFGVLGSFGPGASASLGLTGSDVSGSAAATSRCVSGSGGLGAGSSCPPLVRPVPLVLPSSPGVPRPVLPTVCMVESPAHCNTTEEWVGVIKGSTGLVMLSRDTGERPFPAGLQHVVPGHIVVGDDRFTISWD